MVCVRSPSCAISRGILYGCPVLDLLGSVSSSAVWYTAARRCGTAFLKASSQSIVDPIAPCPCATPQPPICLFFLLYV